MASKIPYGYWLDPKGKLIPVEDPQGHAAKAIDLLQDRFVYILELGYVRVVVEKPKKTIFFETGNTYRPSFKQFKVLKELAQDLGDYKLVNDNTGRQLDIYEKNAQELVGKLLEKTASGKRAWKDRYYSKGSDKSV